MFSLAVIEKYVDGTPPIASIFLYDDKDTAISEFYYKMWAGMNAINIKEISITIQSDTGSVIRFEKWTRPTTESDARPELESEPELGSEMVY